MTVIILARCELNRTPGSRGAEEPGEHDQGFGARMQSGGRCPHTSRHGNSANPDASLGMFLTPTAPANIKQGWRFLAMQALEQVHAIRYLPTRIGWKTSRLNRISELILRIRSFSACTRNAFL